MVICLERGADLHMAQLMPLPLTVSCFSNIQIGFTFLVPAHLGSPGQRTVKRLCVTTLGTFLINMKKRMEYEVEVPLSRGRPKRTWREVVKEDCQARKLNTEDAVDHSKWRKLIKDVR